MLEGFNYWERVHAAHRYSWISPPRMSRRRTWAAGPEQLIECGAVAMRGGVDQFGFGGHVPSQSPIRHIRSCYFIASGSAIGSFRHAGGRSSVGLPSAPYRSGTYMLSSGGAEFTGS